MAEPLVHITPTISVPRSRAYEWFIGLRPLPGKSDEEARQYFESGHYSADDVARLLARHRALEAEEAGEPQVPGELRAWLISQGWQPPADGD